jgi:hypothetical protein
MCENEMVMSESEWSDFLERFRIKCIHIRTKRCSFRIRIA